MRKRIITLEIEVEVPATTGESEVEQAINAALDEPPCEWEDWKVGPATVVDAVSTASEE